MDFKRKNKPRSKGNLQRDGITSDLIAEQTAAFLKGGGKIKKVQPGARSPLSDALDAVGAKR